MIPSPSLAGTQSAFGGPLGALAGILLSLLIPSPVLSGPLDVSWWPAEAQPGTVLLVRVRGAGGGVRGHLGGREILFVRDGGEQRGLGGIDLEEPPGLLPLAVSATGADGREETAEARVRVVPGEFPTQRLTVPRPFVELDPQTLARVEREREGLERLWATAPQGRPWTAPFVAPLANPPVPYGFGARRIINGEGRAPHSGLDFKAEAGTPVLAANDGRVAVAEEHFFAGNSVVLDHGGGLYTMYFHLDRFAVREGDRVARGQVIGTVGATGRSTGPHLHWGVRLSGARVDPMALLRATAR